MNTVSEQLFNDVSAGGKRWAYMSGRLAGALDLAIERLEASQPAKGSATENVITQCKEAIEAFEEMRDTKP